MVAWVPLEGRRKPGARLREYERKRDFGSTPEPASDAGAPAQEGRARFVVQEHSATRLHWDLRLEHEGALASWAIPNGIPQDPDENRKAVHTEDHPLEYLEFHGEIPAGQYGAGTMTIWDRGTYECHKWEDRKVVVTFHGERLSGRYALFAAGSDKDWMIHRMDPADPGREPLPEQLVPMFARESELPESDGDWAYEIKWDGQRALAYLQPGRIHLEDRNLNEITDRYPELRALVRDAGAHEAVLDGVVVAFDDAGRPSAERFEQRAGATSESTIRRRVKSHPVTYVIFDVLHLDGRSLLDEPYAERRRLLEELDLRGKHWQTPAYATADGAGLLAASAERGLPGIVAKRVDGVYEPGRRSDSWRAIGNAAVPRPRSVSAGARRLSGGKAEAEVDGRTLRLSNLDKVLYPATGFTKGDLIDYYAAIAPVLLPHLHRRPLTLKRYPDGVEGEFFYEKRCPGHRPDWVETVAVWSGRNGKEVPYCVVGDAATLVWLANLADIELHTPLARAGQMDRPDMLVFDLDPGEGADIVDCCQVALWIRGMLGEFGLSVYAKTSGSKGMQLYVPLNSEGTTYDTTKPFARAVAETLERQFPDRVVSRMTKALRGGKVLVDWSQNDEHKTTVCVYSVRARETPTVSAPVGWHEVEETLESGDPERLRFTYADVLERVERDGDPFAALLTEHHELPSAG